MAGNDVEIHSGVSVFGGFPDSCQRVGAVIAAAVFAADEYGDPAGGLRFRAVTVCPHIDAGTVAGFQYAALAQCFEAAAHAGNGQGKLPGQFPQRGQAGSGGELPGGDSRFDGADQVFPGIVCGFHRIAFLNCFNVFVYIIPKNPVFVKSAV